jgi:hypothetical protein
MQNETSDNCEYEIRIPAVFIGNTFLSTNYNLLERFIQTSTVNWTLDTGDTTHNTTYNIAFSE